MRFLLAGCSHANRPLLHSEDCPTPAVLSCLWRIYFLFWMDSCPLLLCCVSLSLWCTLQLENISACLSVACINSLAILKRLPALLRFGGWVL